MKKTFVYLAFFLLLIVGFWFFLFQGTDNWKKKLPVLSFLKPFTFKDQDNLPFTERDMKGKVAVVNFFFTKCRGICPNMNANMKHIHEVFKDNPSFLIVSHTCDPDNDSVLIMKRYADSICPGQKGWTFLTGRKDSLYHQARASYLLDDPKNTLEKIEDQFIHTQFFALVDKQGRVRGQVYDGLKPDEINKLIKDVEGLLQEPGTQGSFSNGMFGNNP